MTHELTAEERRPFKRVMRAAIADLVPRRMREDFLANYNCCPPPIFIPLISAIEVRSHSVCFTKQFFFSYSLGEELFLAPFNVHKIYHNFYQLLFSVVFFFKIMSIFLISIFFFCFLSFFFLDWHIHLLRI